MSRSSPKLLDEQVMSRRTFPSSSRPLLRAGSISKGRRAERPSSRSSWQRRRPRARTHGHSRPLCRTSGSAGRGHRHGWYLCD